MSCIFFTAQMEPAILPSSTLPYAPAPIVRPVRCTFGSSNGFRSGWLRRFAISFSQALFHTMGVAGTVVCDVTLPAWGRGGGGASSESNMETALSSA